MIYPALIHKERTSDYGVSFPDFPGCISAHPNLDHAVKEAREALDLHIHGMRDDGMAIPAPSDFLLTAARAAEDSTLWGVVLIEGANAD